MTARRVIGFKHTSLGSQLIFEASTACWFSHRGYDSCVHHAGRDSNRLLFWFYAD